MRADQYLLHSSVSSSGGRGKLGYCGGINNPVHYVRLKLLASWVTDILHTMKVEEIGDIDGAEETSQLCWRD